MANLVNIPPFEGQQAVQLAVATAVAAFDKNPQLWLTAPQFTLRNFGRTVHRARCRTLASVDSGESGA